MRLPVVSCLFAAMATAGVPVGAASPTGHPPSAPADVALSPMDGLVETDEIIVRVERGVARAAVSADVEDAASAVDSEVVGVRAAASVADTYLVTLSEPVGADAMGDVIAAIERDPDVVYAEPNVLARTQLVPDDPSYASGQWSLRQPQLGTYGVNAAAAWDVTTGSATVNVAVLDTGSLAHPDMAGRFSGGYDFVSGSNSNDGGGRDTDPSDPGDWCGTGPSSWHGLHVAGTIGAATDNGVGVAGLDWSARIVPVRVLGTCTGSLLDIADGLRWAAGLAVSGVPANTAPAKVLNLSLGGSGACPVTFQSAVDDVTATGAVVVAAAGNQSGDVSNVWPANCDDVITVGATNRVGSLASYSNFGAAVDIAAPGGDSDGSGAILSTGNAGATTPGAHTYTSKAGTSMATPHVSGVLSLMLSIDPSLTPAQLLAILQSTATPFPFGSSCTTGICGAGIVDAAAAVQTIAGLPTTVPAFVPIEPVRLVETRPSEPAGAVVVETRRYGGAAGFLEIPVTAVAGIPAQGVDAVALNVTATDPTGSGYVSVYPCGAAPTASNLNFDAGDTVPNVVIAQVSDVGTVCLDAPTSTHLVVDANGWFGSGSGFEPVSPARLLETRTGNPSFITVDGLFQGGGMVGAGQVLTLQVAGRGGVAADASAVALNVTATQPTGGGYVTVYPCDATRPTASNLNYTAGDTVPNAVVVRLSSAGTVCLYTLRATHLLVDVNGWFTSSSDLEPVVPARLLETRTGNAEFRTIDRLAEGIGVLQAGTPLELQVAGRGGVAADAAAAVLNVTVTQPAAGGYLTAYPCDGARPLASNLNFVAGQTVPNAVVVQLSADGTVCLYSVAATHLVVDVNGWFMP
jgi:subtilisin family serine protease